MISPKPWNWLPPRYPHSKALVASFLTIYMFAKCRSTVVSPYTDPYGLISWLVYWQYLVIRGIIFYRVTLIWRVSSQASRRSVHSLNSVPRLHCYMPDCTDLHHHNSFGYILWSVEQIPIVLDTFERPRFRLSNDTHVHGILLTETTNILWSSYLLTSDDARYIWKDFDSTLTNDTLVEWPDMQSKLSALPLYWKELVPHINSPLHL